jgi:hypothetical protein
MTDILEEILNDKNEERTLYYFKKMLPIAMICTILVVLFMLVNNWNENKKIENNKKIGDILVNTIRIINDNQASTIKSLDNLILTSNNKVKDLAIIEQIGIKINQGDTEDAKILLQNVINDAKYDELTTAYARLIWLSVVIDETDLSKINTNEMNGCLNYFDDENKAFFGTANIIKAIWYIKNNSIDLAIDTLKKILSSKNATQTSKDQARALLSNLQ